MDKERTSHHSVHCGNMFNITRNKLNNNDHLVFNSNILLNSNGYSLFTNGFQSSDQKIQMSHANSLYMNATYNITLNSRTIMYFLVIKDAETDHGVPVAYTFTNDQDADPVIHGYIFKKL
ncbi:unnamed protein product [Cunninghamella echinulata]